MITVHTDHRARVVNIPASDSGGTGFKYSSGDQLSRVFSGFPHSISVNAWILP